jgi:hypothetical protein
LAARWIGHRFTAVVRAFVSGDELPVAVGSAESFEPYRSEAATPAVRLLETDGGVTLYWDLPGAGRKNTEVVWDPEHRRLSVGVWSKPPAAADRGRQPRKGRLSWHGSVGRPRDDGTRATARLASGCVCVHLPRSADRHVRGKGGAALGGPGNEGAPSAMASGAHPAF